MTHQSKEKKTPLSDLQERDSRHVWHPYTQHQTAAPPLPVVKAKDAVLYLENGAEIIDGVASWWTNTLGHAHPYIAERVYDQMLRLEHVIFAGFTHPPGVELAERLLNLLPANQGKVFYSDNGSTAVEIAVKIAVQYFHNQKIRRKKLVAFDNAFHGETFGAMSASGDLGLNNAFAEHLFEVVRIPEPYAGQETESYSALENALADEDVCAFIFEPLVQGSSGMKMYEPEALDRLLTICEEKGVLTIADEVMTGFYRTGRLFACDYLEKKPDIFALGKGLTAGALPLAATTCTNRIFNGFLSNEKSKTLFHGHSFTGNPTGCAAALASLDLLEREETRHRVRRIYERHAAFKKKIETHRRAVQVRHRGTILAVEFATPEKTSYFNNLRDTLYQFFLDNGVLLRPLGNVIYILPPYCITDEQSDKIYRLIERALDEVGV